ncbi:MAG: methyltransferase domain-containing protein [Nitriliruptoraceae bacterium]
MEQLDLATARWLTSADGLAAVTDAGRSLADGADELQAAETLARTVLEPERRAAALSAAIARERARARWPRADALLFTREALEQASDPAVAAWRARELVARLTDLLGAPPTEVHDLAAGVGGDTIALARALPDGQVTAVDQDPARLELLRHNCKVHGLTVTRVEGDALTHAVTPGAGIHADPGRRTGGRRVRRLSAHLPSVPALLDAHAEAALVAVAVAPGLDPHDPELPVGVEITFVQLGDQLLEATIWAGEGGTAAATRTGAVLLDPDGTEVARLRAQIHPSARGTHDPEPNATHDPDPGPDPDPDPDAAPQGDGSADPDAELPIGDVGSWLIEVAPAAVRARRHDALGRAIGARRLAHTRALLTTDEPVPPSPWYRARPVLAVLPARPKEVRRWLASPAAADHLGGGVEVVLHGVDADVDDLLRGFGRPRTGPHGLRIELVRLDRGSVAVVTSAAGLPPSGRLDA